MTSECRLCHAESPARICKQCLWVIAESISELDELALVAEEAALTAPDTGELLKLALVASSFVGQLLEQVTAARRVARFVRVELGQAEKTVPPGGVTP